MAIAAHSQRLAVTTSSSVGEHNSIRPLPMLSPPTYVEMIPAYLRRKTALAQRKAFSPPTIHISRSFIIQRSNSRRRLGTLSGQIEDDLNPQRAIRSIVHSCAMGIDRLAALLKMHAGPKEKIVAVSTHSPGRTIIGVDMSCKMVEVVKSQAGAEQYHQTPPHPAHHVAHTCLSYLRSMAKQNLCIIPVFDGETRTILKAGYAGRKRDTSTENHRLQLEECLQTPLPSTEEARADVLSNITKYRKRSAKVNASVRAEVMKVLKENGFEYVMAPFEADWQLAYMLNSGIIHAIATTDSDYWALCSNPCLLLNVTQDMKGWICHSDGSLLRGDSDSISIKGERKGDHHLTRTGAILRATIFGNDYYSGTAGVGVGRWDDAVKQHGNDVDMIVEHFSNVSEEFLAAYTKMTNIYNHVPVLEMERTNEYDMSRGCWKYHFTGNMISLSGSSFSSIQWIELIGFNPHDCIYTKYNGDASSRPSYSDIGRGEWFPGEGAFYQSSFIARKQNEKGQALPYGHDLDFTACPPCYQPSSAMERWLNVRGYQRRKRHDIVGTVNRMRMKSTDVMTEADCSVLLPKCIRYSGLEVLVPSVGACFWEDRDLSILRKVKFSGKVINAKFGKHNGVRRRALQRVMNGHYYINTLKMTEAKSIATPSRPSRKVYIVQCEVLGSMRKNIYRVHLVANANGEYIKAPYSRCSCAAGNLFCAHMLGLMCICRIAQIRPSWDRIELMKKLPSHVLQVQRQVIPVRILFSERLNSKKKK